MFRRTISTLLCLCMALSSVPFSAFAETMPEETAATEETIAVTEETTAPTEETTAPTEEPAQETTAPTEETTESSEPEETEGETTPTEEVPEYAEPEEPTVPSEPEETEGEDETSADDLVPKRKAYNGPIYEQVISEDGRVKYVVRNAAGSSILFGDGAASSNLTKLETPTDLKWHVGYETYWDLESGTLVENPIERMGSISWQLSGPCYDSFKFCVCIYKDDKLWSENWWRYDGIDGLDYFSVDDFIYSDPESGTYYFTVTSIGDGVFYADSDTARSESFQYVKPSARVSKVTNLKWEWPRATWQQPSSAQYVGGFEVVYYYSATRSGTPTWAGTSRWLGNTDSWYNAIYDYPLSNGAGYYSFRVRAFSEDITVACNGEWSELSESYYWDGSSIKTPEPVEYHDTLASLTDLDYLAFSAVAYLPFGTSGTLRENMIENGYWEEIWSEKQGITYAELCAHIASWKVGTNHNLSSYNGFYAVSFTNDNNENVIAYRGSVPPEELFSKLGNTYNSWDFYCDWFLNDLPLELGNTMGPQLKYALDIYDQVKGNNSSSNVVLTGHSLGGAWATAVSAYSGCKAITFNAVSILDVLYKHDPEMMAKVFTGADKWNFVDHTNQYDLLAGMFEKYVSLTEMKPYVAHKSNIPVDSSVLSLIIGTVAGLGVGGPIGGVIGGIGAGVGGYIAQCHGLQSYVVKNKDDKVTLTEVVSNFKPKSVITNYMVTANHSVDFGSSGSNIIEKGSKVLVPRTSFGGNADDRIDTSWQNDNIIGGKGVDALDGSWGDDTYIYYLGDGYDIISDVSGNDVLKLCGFGNTSNIRTELSDDNKYVNIYYNDECIISVRSKNRAESDNTFTISYDNGAVENISAYLKGVKYSSTLNIKCPVSVEVLDSEGNVVYILEDEETGNHYTDYGNFYIYQEETGGYGKMLDLIEGYTARIVGQDTGTMEIEHRNVTNGELSEESKEFADVPITVNFTATFEETNDGELVLAADTDGDKIVDAKIGYDGQVIPVESIIIDREYIALKPDEEVSLSADVQPAELTEFLRWKVESDEDGIISIDEKGNVTALKPGTAYVLATVDSGVNTITARCRVDVVETETIEEVERIQLDGIQLGATKATTELYSTNYTEIDVLLKLLQNESTLSANGDSQIPDAKGVAIEGARFTDETVAKYFDLIPMDDRRLAIVPTDYAVKNPKEVKGSYKSTVAVTVDGVEHPGEVLTLTVKKSTPKLKVTIPAFNSFQSGQIQEMTITGGTVTEIAVDESKATAKTPAIPDWLTQEGQTLRLNKNAPLKSVSGKVYLNICTEEWRIPAAVTLTVKNTYKTPGLKLSATTVTMTPLAEDSNGVTLKLVPTSKKDTLDSLKVEYITAPEGWSVSPVNTHSGEFTLTADTIATPGKITLNVSFRGTNVTLPLTLTVKNAAVKLKLSKTTVTLNKAVSDSTEVTVTATPADFRLNLQDYTLTDSKGVDRKNSGELEIRLNGGAIKVATTDTTVPNSTYKLSVSAGESKPVVLTIKTIEKDPTVSYKAKGTLDLSFPETTATITPTFKNYSGGFTLGTVTAVDSKKQDASHNFRAEQNGTTISVTCAAETQPGTYTLNVPLTIADGSPVGNTVKVTVKRTAVKLKLSSTKLSLNKLYDDIGEIGVTCTTKGYAFTKPVWDLMDKTGKVTAEGELKVEYINGKLVISILEATDYGATYKLLVRANKDAPATTLTITIPTEAKSNITSSLKAKGSIDVIRDGSAVTLTPTYKNCTVQTAKVEELIFTKTENKVATNANGLFSWIRNDDGTFTITRAKGAELNHSAKYTVTLVTYINGTKVCESKPISLSVKQGSAKLSLTTLKGTMFAMDKHSRGEFLITAADTTLNPITRVEIKDTKYQDRLEVYGYGNGAYYICFADEMVDNSLVGKTITVTLNVFLEGNQIPTKANTTVKLKLTVVK